MPCERSVSSVALIATGNAKQWLWAASCTGRLDEEKKKGRECEEQDEKEKKGDEVSHSWFPDDRNYDCFRILNNHLRFLNKCTNNLFQVFFSFKLYEKNYRVLCYMLCIKK